MTFKQKLLLVLEDALTALAMAAALVAMLALELAIVSPDF